jgi:hypothetical protein
MKKRVNAKENKFEVIFPPDGKIEKLTGKLKKYPPLDYRIMIDEASNEKSGISLDDAFKGIVSRRTKKQIADVLAALGVDEGDPDRFVKGFVLLSMVTLGVGIVGFTSAPRKIARWTEHHNDLLLALMNHFRSQKLKDSAAIRSIAMDPMFENWFPYKKQTGIDPTLSEETRRVESLRQRWQSLKRRERATVTVDAQAILSRAIGTDAEPSFYRHILTALEIRGASKNRKKAT